MAGFPSQVAAAVQADWSAAFGRRDLPRLVALYTADALFYGSKAELFRGHDGVLGYFASLSPSFKQARFDVPSVVVPAPGVIAASGLVSFEVEEAGSLRPRRYRMTQVLVSQDGAWLIAAHHASPVPG